jgi:hypothetical protein
MNVRKLLSFGGIPLAAVLLFWIGGYAFFKSSDDWQALQALISKSPEARQSAGEIRSVEVALFPFFYRFSGDSASAKLRVTVSGNRGTYTKTIEASKSNGSWSIADKK